MTRDEGSIRGAGRPALGLIVAGLASGLALWCAAGGAARARGVDPVRLVPGALQTKERLRVVFLLAQFPDQALERPRSAFTDPDEKNGLAERLTEYYAEASGRRLILDIVVADSVVTVAEERVRYVQRPADLTRDAFRAYVEKARGEPALSALETADAVIVFFAGPGKESDLKGGANDPWSNFTTVAPALTTPGGHRIRNACVIAAEQREGLSSFGVLCHEFGHLLGLPELYAPGGATHEGIGVWGLMGQGTWLGMGDRPPQLCAWSKVLMGWADVRLVEKSGRVTLPAIGARTEVAKIWARGPEHPREYFLIENRQRRDTDRRLPGSGLLVWHVDERVTGYRTSQSDPARMRLTLMQADGRDDLRVGNRAGGNRGDAGDPWRGMSESDRRKLDALIVLGLAFTALGGTLAWRARRITGRAVVSLLVGASLAAAGLLPSRSPTFGPDTIPSSASWDGRPGRFTLSGISAPGDPMSFTVSIHSE